MAQEFGSNPLQKLLLDSLGSLAGNKMQQVQQRQGNGMQNMQQTATPERVELPTAQEDSLQLEQNKGKMQKSPRKLTGDAYTDKLNELINPKNKSGKFEIPAGLTKVQATDLYKFRTDKKTKHYAKKKDEIAQQDAAFKATEPFRASTVAQGREARAVLENLDRLEEIEKNAGPNFPTAGFNEFLNRSGFDIPSILKGEGEEYNKILANFVKGAKEAFGARVSNFELESFLKSIPNLSQSPEGRKRVIANLKKVYRINNEANKIMKNIIKKNNGVPPKTLREDVDDTLEERADKFASQFRKDLEKPSAPAQNSLITAGQAALGSLVGNPGPLIGGGLGAILGGGIPGALGGAAIGQGIQKGISNIASLFKR